MKRYLLKRLVDESGNSGTGYVAEAVVFNDGTCVVHWDRRTNRAGVSSTVVYRWLEDAVRVHGHDGKTEFQGIEDRVLDCVDPAGGRHFRQLCRHCGEVIMQCRCPGPKPITYGVCEACRKAGLR